jgi:hypothetical protein
MDQDYSPFTLEQECKRDGFWSLGPSIPIDDVELFAEDVLSV